MRKCSNVRKGAALRTNKRRKLDTFWTPVFRQSAMRCQREDCVWVIPKTPSALLVVFPRPPFAFSIPARISPAVPPPTRARGAAVVCCHFVTTHSSSHACAGARKVLSQNDTTFAHLPRVRETPRLQRFILILCNMSHLPRVRETPAHKKPAHRCQWTGR